MKTQAPDSVLAQVEKHLELELAFATELESLNHATSEVMSRAGVRGPTLADLENLGPQTEDIQQSSLRLTRARRVLLERLNTELNAQFNSLRSFIATLPQPTRGELDTLRTAVLKRASKAQADLITNQATLFYTFDFHRKFLAGILQTDGEQTSYRADGHSPEVAPGNLYRKTC